MPTANRLIGVFAFCLLQSTVAFAQGGAEPADPTTTPIQWYTSVTGVGVATIFLVSLAKRALTGIEFAGKIPTWIYAVLIAFGLTYLCVVVWGTLPGQFWQLAYQAVINAAVASGVYEWIDNKDTSLHDSAISAGVTGLGRRTHGK